MPSSAWAVSANVSRCPHFVVREDGWSKILAGMTTVEEIVRVTKTDVSAIV